MSLQIGRVTGLLVRDRPSMNGDELELAGWVETASVEHRDVVVHQLRSLAGQGPLPVIFGDTPALDGFYTVAAISADPWHDPDPVVFWQARLVRSVRSSVMPIVEQTTTASLRPTTEPIVLASAAVPVFVPANAAWRDDPAPATLLETATGNLYRHDHPHGEIDTVIAQAAVLPADFYVGACTLEWRASPTSSTWYTIGHGRQIPPTADIRQLRLGNGRVRMAFTVSTRPLITVDFYLAGWITMPGTFEFKIDDQEIVQGRTPVVLRNDPETAAIRVFGQNGLQVDIALRRGDGFYELRGRLPAGYNPPPREWELIQSGGGAGAAFSGGVAADAVTGDGLRWMMLAPSPTKDIVTPCRVYGSTSAEGGGVPWDCAFGIAHVPVSGEEFDIVWRNYFTGLAVSESVVS